MTDKNEVLCAHCHEHLATRYENGLPVCDDDACKAKRLKLQPPKPDDKPRHERGGRGL